jgi:hypothetical protein
LFYKIKDPKHETFCPILHFGALHLPTSNIKDQPLTILYTCPAKNGL